MIKNQNIPFLLLAGFIFIGLKVFHRVADTELLRFLLAPTNAIIELVTNSNSTFISTSGYFHESLNIVINKSCSGFNFWVLCFIMLTFLVLPFLKNNLQKITAIPVVLIGAFILTILVNASRILFSLFIHEKLINLLGTKTWLHQAEGTFIYCSFLILIYLGLEYFLKNVKNRYEKSTAS